MRKFLTTSLFLIIPILITLLIAPKLNIKIYKVSSPSMEPTIPTNSLVVVQKTETLRINDVISYKQSCSDSTITHRITDIFFINGKHFFNTKGDNNEEKDPQPISEKEVVGKVVMSIPYLGTIVTNKNKTLIIFSILAGFMSGIFLKKISL